MLIFLNRTGFNGLFRLNRQGGFNVPAGRYTDPRICDEGHICAVAAAALDSPRGLDPAAPFDETLAEAARGDFVYCDPPYAPLSRTSSFANYTADGFTAFDQRVCSRRSSPPARAAHALSCRTPARSEILKVYTTLDAQKVQLKISRVPARRAINSRASSRGPVDELIISNVMGAADRAANGEGIPETRPLTPERSHPHPPSSSR